MGKDTLAKSALSLCELDRLVRGYRDLARPAGSETLVRFREFLDGYSRFQREVAAQESICVLKEARAFPQLHEGFLQAVDKWRISEESTASEFNLLQVLGLVSKEVRHSMVLAWLLDRDILGEGTHAQGNLGFRFFLEELRLPREYADNPRYYVRREKAGDESRIDVEIAAQNDFLIHIENKIWSGLGSQQLEREWNDLHKTARRLNVQPSNTHGLYLTPDGRQSPHPGFKSISWGQVAHILDQFAELAKPQDVKIFAKHYARGLRKFIVTEAMERTDEDEHETVQ